MRTLAIGDIHGGFRALKELMDKLQIRKDDQFIFLGDYVDGWSESAQVVQYLIALSENYNCTFIKGNHDVWCEHWLRLGEANAVWLEHGGQGTMKSYEAFDKANKKQHLEFFESMKLYHIDNQNRLFLHAGFTSMHGVENESHKENFYFDRTLWEMALTMDKRIQKNSELYPDRLKHYNEIYIGHTPTINYKITEPMHAINVWNVDTGAAFTGPLSAIDIDTKAIFQTDKVMEFYPDENGRNKN
ncbi:metallophosphoesterase family protein [Winogradskyella bathintestinalis]|uniref:Metallophosphoesterase family protein n=1 Tax=Winogradskyella bathintestinalis TaxID=3035208 RepID=A0ABT7ZQU7_9FLAO|nr:metallophosphoesterase family protein [Winogradskyella bathintestinalis]MDN3491184.1 metallophosphoesterase family protein [Winogradskyella bathintestinalis]